MLAPLWIALHKNSLLCRFLGKLAAFRWKTTFSFRKHSFASFAGRMRKEFRKEMEDLRKHRKSGIYIVKF